MPGFVVRDLLLYLPHPHPHPRAPGSPRGRPQLEPHLSQGRVPDWRCAPSGDTHCPCAAGRKLRSYSTSETGCAGCLTSGCSSTEHPAVPMNRAHHLEERALPRMGHLQKPRILLCRYSLTPEGLELAQKLAELEGLSSLNVGIRPEEPPGEEAEVPGTASAELGAGEAGVQQPLLELGPGEYSLLLCVDVGETTGAGHRPKLLRELQRLRVPHTVRRLHVGDFVWVAQETRPRDPAARPGELVLDHIVERKRLDDLCSSIIDGRFREQKFRLKRCGLGHRVYLVEEHGSVQNLSLPESTLLQAVTNTQVIDGFFVKRTADIKESAAYLALLTRGLQRLYQGHTLRSRPWGTPGNPESGAGPSPNPLCSLLTFSDFNAGAIKNKAQSVREVFARQLMQVRGVSGEKAAALVDRYSTPARLLAAYDACATPKEQESLLSTIKCGRLQRNLGPALSRTLAQLYCSCGPLT
ncbi:structure-specific endonuclease subunit MUS81 isoform X3 [Tamandua tetradactyla]|uniref:structure-specific endonuclease subunit MUS81 isoform X3 n=1 Tax=Tamandua tetradactyla TaxID=48850 RepID=UPI0040547C29